MSNVLTSNVPYVLNATTVLLIIILELSALKIACMYWENGKILQYLQNRSFMFTIENSISFHSFEESKGAFMLNFWGQNQRFQTWLEQNAVAFMLIFE